MKKLIGTKDICVHFKTKIEYYKFIHWCQKQGYKWRSGAKAEDFDICESISFLNIQSAGVKINIDHTIIPYLTCYSNYKDDTHSLHYSFEQFKGEFMKAKTVVKKKQVTVKKKVFKLEPVSIGCRTNKERDELLTWFEKKGIEWVDGSKPTEWIPPYPVREVRFCYDRELSFSNRKYKTFIPEPVISFTRFKKEYMFNK